MKHFGYKLGWNNAGILAIIVIYLIVLFLALAYILLDTLSVYDAPGHVLAVYTAKAHLPAWSFWSSDFLGWSQGSSYPPGIHWIMACFATFMGVTAAVKAVVVVSIIVLPYSIWRYLRSIQYDGIGGFLVFIFLFIVLLVAPDYMGSSISSLFNLGLITNFVAMPLLFFFMTSVEYLIKDGSKANVVVVGFLLGILFWVHMVIAIIGVAYLFVVILQKLANRKLKDLTPLFISVLLGLLFSAPFIISMLSSMKNQGWPGEGIASLLIPNILTFLLSLFVGFKFFKKGKQIPLRLSTLSAAFALVCTLDGLLFLVFKTSFFIERFHVYRFQIFAYLFFVLAASGLVIHNLEYKSTKTKNQIKVVAVLTLLAIILMNNPYNFSYACVKVNDDIAVNGRFLESFSRSESYPSPYSFQVLLAESNSSSSWAYGLFVESAPNSAYLKSLSRSLSKDVNLLTPGLQSAKLVPIDEVILPENRLEDALELFAIENVISLNGNSISSSGTWARNGTEKYYHINDLNKQSLAEVPKFKLVPIKSNWNVAVSDWWRGIGPITTLPYDASSQIITVAIDSYNSNIIVDIIEQSEHKISLDIRSLQPVPVLIKTTYSSDWKARTVDGRKIIIFKAAPYLMLVQASGRVDITNG